VLSDHANLFQSVSFLFDLFFIRANGLKIITDDGDIASTYATINSDGSVTLATAANFVSSCSVDIKYYPFDAQNCYLIVSTSVQYLRYR